MRITAADLHATLGDPRLRMCDVRWSLGRPGAGRAAHAAGHLPGAIFVDVDGDLATAPGAGRHPLPDPTAFARRMAELGIGRGHRVVAYDDAGGTVAARLWWMLDAMGHPDAALLDGGLPAWTAAGFPLESGPVVREPATALPAPRTWPRTIDRGTLRARLGTLDVIDVRAPERYRGEVEPIDPVAGHIPTARSAPTTGNLGPDGRFLPAEALVRRFAALSARDGGHAGSGGSASVVACGSGINACHTLYAMRLAGLPDGLLYPGSYSDWSRAGLPVVVGPDRGSPPDD